MEHIMSLGTFQKFPYFTHPPLSLIIRPKSTLGTFRNLLKGPPPAHPYFGAEKYTGYFSEFAQGTLTIFVTKSTIFQKKCTTHIKMYVSNLEI